MPFAHLTVGSGPQHVFGLHGWFGSQDGWGGLQKYLDGDRFSYHFVNYRGYGPRMTQPGKYTLDEIADDVLTLADDLDVASFSLIGHSMGGAAIQRILALAPDRVVKMVGIAPVAAVPTPFDDAGKALFYGAADSRDNRYAIVDFTTGNRNTPTWINQVVDHSLANSTRESFGGHLDAWANADFADEVRGKSLPVLAVVGAHDQALGQTVINQTWLPLYPNCRVAVIDNAGHYPMDEAPINLATVIEAFLSE